MRQDTAPQLAILLFDGTRGGVYLSTEPVSRRLVASAGKPDCTSAFLRCAGQLVSNKASERRPEVYAGSGREQGRGKASGTYAYTRMLTPLIDGLGHAT